MHESKTALLSESGAGQYRFSLLNHGGYRSELFLVKRSSFQSQLELHHFIELFKYLTVTNLKSARR